MKVEKEYNYIDNDMEGEDIIKFEKLRYILITPAKDEEDNLPTLIQSIVNQSLQPIAWFIVDDGSEDRTSQIVSQASSEHLWIHSVRLDTKHTYDLGKHYAAVCIIGFNQAISYCEQNDLEFSYIALSDADMVYPINYFEKCIGFLHNNSMYGIVSGNLLNKGEQDESYVRNNIRLGEGKPPGTGRVWRKESFVDTGGYLLVKGPDTISNIIAIVKGWKIKRLYDVVFYQTREMAIKHSIWDGFYNVGDRLYYVNANPLLILNSIVSMIFINPQKNGIYKSFALFCGYCKSLFLRECQIEIDEVKKYMGSYKRVLRIYFLFIRNLISKGGR